MAYRALKNIDKRSLLDFATTDFFDRSGKTDDCASRADISTHTVVELSGVTDEGRSWVAYFNTTTQRSAVWLLRNKHHSSSVGHFLTGWTELSPDAIDDFVKNADSGSLEVEQYLATTLPYWFWEEKLAPQTLCESQNRALRKATFLATREAAINLTLKLVSVLAIGAFALGCTAFWMSTLRLVA